jgi:ribosomal protein S18 acetylase RimI-like enzyme
MTSSGGEHPLDNAVWHALGSQHAELAETKGRARRYPADMSVFHAVDVADADGWEHLAALAGPAARVSLFRAEIPSPPRGWTEHLRGKGRQMTVSAATLVHPREDDVGGEADDDHHRFRRLGPDDIGEALALVALTEPGPFAERTIEMGRYWGRFDDDRLVAMAGERFHLEGYTEISAVCTHPDVRGQGLASALTGHVARAILERDETPFLHVRVGNESARRVYERLGFAERRLVEFALLETPPA